MLEHFWEACTSNWLEGIFLLKRLKILYYNLLITYHLTVEKIIKSFYEKEFRKINQT